MATKLKHIEFNNKTIPVIFKKHKTLPIFNLQLVFKNSGYINDTNLSGLTNLSAKILNEGTLKEGSKFYEDLENNAIEIDVQAGFETFVIEVSCLKVYLNIQKLAHTCLLNKTLQLQMSQIQLVHLFQLHYFPSLHKTLNLLLAYLHLIFLQINL